MLRKGSIATIVSILWTLQYFCTQTHKRKQQIKTSNLFVLYNSVISIPFDRSTIKSMKRKNKIPETIFSRTVSFIKIWGRHGHTIYGQTRRQKIWGRHGDKMLYATCIVLFKLLWRSEMMCFFSEEIPERSQFAHSIFLNLSQPPFSLLQQINKSLVKPLTFQ